MNSADNLIGCNKHFPSRAKKWHAQGKSAGPSRVKVARRFARISFQIIAGQQVFRHPSRQARHYLLDKLNVFHREHQTPMADGMRDLQAAVEQLPQAAHAAEAVPLAKELEKIQTGHRYGPRPLAEVLPIVLARLGVVPVESKKSGEKDLRSSCGASEPRTPSDPKAQSLNKAWRSLGSATPATAVWGPSPDVPVGRDADRMIESEGSLLSTTVPEVFKGKPLPSGP